MSTQDTAVELSGQLKTIAVSLMKIANDLRWMNSGPLAGLGEIALPALQPGSSIMPGKVNPVIPEAATMVAAQVIGNDATITIAGQSGNFQLNVMLPVIAYNLLESIRLLANASRALADSAIAGFTVNKARLAEALDRNPILVTALNPVIGYEKGAAIAKKAYAEGRPILRGGRSKMTDLPRERAGASCSIPRSSRAAASRAARAAAAERFDCRPGRPEHPGGGSARLGAIIRSACAAASRARVDEWLRARAHGRRRASAYRQYFPAEPVAGGGAGAAGRARARAHRAADPARHATASNHAGQISFPGGRIEPGDAGPQRPPRCARRTRRSGSMPDFVSVVGYLPDHVVMSGFRVTPVVGFRAAGLRAAARFRGGRGHLRGAAGLRVRPGQSSPARAPLGLRRGERGGVCDIPYGERNIWGATAGMLLTLYRLCVRGTARMSARRAKRSRVCSS